MGTERGLLTGRSSEPQPNAGSSFVRARPREPPAPTVTARLGRFDDVRSGSGSAMPPPKAGNGCSLVEAFMNGSVIGPSSHNPGLSTSGADFLRSAAAGTGVGSGAGAGFAGALGGAGGSRPGRRRGGSGLRCDRLVAVNDRGAGRVGRHGGCRSGRLGVRLFPQIAVPGGLEDRLGLGLGGSRNGLGCHPGGRRRRAVAASRLRADHFRTTFSEDLAGDRLERFGSTPVAGRSRWTSIAAPAMTSSASVQLRRPVTAPSSVVGSCWHWNTIGTTSASSRPSSPRGSARRLASASRFASSAERLARIGDEDDAVGALEHKHAQCVLPLDVGHGVQVHFRRARTATWPRFSGRKSKNRVRFAVGRDRRQRAAYVRSGLRAWIMSADWQFCPTRAGTVVDDLALDLALGEVDLCHRGWISPEKPGIHADCLETRSEEEGGEGLSAINR